MYFADLAYSDFFFTKTQAMTGFLNGFYIADYSSFYHLDQKSMTGIVVGVCIAITCILICVLILINRGRARLVFQMNKEYTVYVPNIVCCIIAS